MDLLELPSPEMATQELPSPELPAGFQHFSIFDPSSPLPRLRSQRRVEDNNEDTNEDNEDNNEEAGGTGDDRPAGNNCVVCYVNVRSHVAVPCGHAMFCDTCVTALTSHQITECPVCKTEVTSYITFFNC